MGETDRVWIKQAGICQNRYKEGATDGNRTAQNDVFDVPYEHQAWQKPVYVHTLHLPFMKAVCPGAGRMDS
jgi:hypothetical protein